MAATNEGVTKCKDCKNMSTSDRGVFCISTKGATTIGKKMDVDTYTGTPGEGTCEKYDPASLSSITRHEISQGPCPNCGVNSWNGIYIANGLQEFTCRNPKCNFKKIKTTPVKEMPWNCELMIYQRNSVQLCKATNASCNGTRIVGKCIKKLKGGDPPSLASATPVAQCIQKKQTKPVEKKVKGLEAWLG